MNEIRKGCKEERSKNCAIKTCLDVLKKDQGDEESEKCEGSANGRKSIARTGKHAAKRIKVVEI